MKTVRTLFLACLASIGFSANAQEKIIAVTELPTAAQQFIKTHFTAQPPVQVISDTEYMILKEYEVVLNDGTKIEFEKNGQWKEIRTLSTAIPAAIVPKSITAYVKKSFPDTQIIKLEKERTGFEIKLNNGIEIDFDSNGNFIRIDH